MIAKRQLLCDSYRFTITKERYDFEILPLKERLIVITSMA